MDCAIFQSLHIVQSSCPIVGLKKQFCQAKPCFEQLLPNSKLDFFIPFQKSKTVAVLENTLTSFRLANLEKEVYIFAEEGFKYLNYTAGKSFLLTSK